MAKGFSMKVTGAKELDRKLRQLSKAAAGKASRRAVRAGAKVVQAAAKDNATAIVGGEMGKLLKRALVVRGAKRKRRGFVSINAMLSPKFTDQFLHTTKSGKRYYIPTAIEYGHGAEKATAARPFFRRAWDETRQRALAKVLRTMLTEIELAGKKP